jgi:hypothetical protein
MRQRAGPTLGSWLGCTNVGLLKRLCNHAIYGRYRYYTEYVVFAIEVLNVL